MAVGKKSFLLYADIISTVEQLPNEKAGELFKMILEYVNDKNPIAEDLLIKIAFEPIKQQLKRDLNKYNGLVERARKNGLKGGRPKKEINQEEPKKPSGLIENQEKPVNVNVTVNDTVKVKETKNNINERKIWFFRNLQQHEDEFGKQTLNEFFDYWSEPNKLETKMRFELEKTWSIKMRLKRWKKINYGKSNSNKEVKPTRINKFINQDKKSELGRINSGESSPY